MTSGRPASLTWVVGGEFVRVALGAQSTSPREKHRGVLRTVRVMTFSTTASSETGYWIVLIHERASFVGMASNALALERTLSNLGSLRWVNCMTIAADELTFRHRVVEIQPKFGEFRLVALAAKGYFVSLQQHLLFRLLSRMDEAYRILGLSSIKRTVFQRQFGIWVQLVTGYASKVGLCVIRMLPM